MVYNLNDFWFQLFRHELDELWCLLTWFTWTIVNAYWLIGPLQSPVLKEHLWLLDIQYSPQSIDESLKWFKFVHINIWLWQLKTHGHNATSTSMGLSSGTILYLTILSITTPNLDWYSYAGCPSWHHNIKSRSQIENESYPSG